jgi:hypothetical protein
MLPNTVLAKQSGVVIYAPSQKKCQYLYSPKDFVSQNFSA